METTMTVRTLDAWAETAAGWSPVSCVLSSVRRRLPGALGTAYLER